MWYPSLETFQGLSEDKMVNLRQALADRIRDFMCAATEPGAQFTRWLDGAISTVPGVGGIGLPGADISLDLRGIVCPSPGGSPSGSGFNITYPPSTPILGQCDGVIYEGTFRYDRPDGINDRGGIPRVFGPIQAVQVRAGSNQRVVECICRGLASAPIQPSGTSVAIAGASNPEFAMITEFTVTRVDGLPDDCGGDTPQQPPTGNAPVTYDDPDGNPVEDEPWDFLPDFPFRLPNGNIIIPFGVFNGNLTLNADFNLSIDEVSFNFGGKGGQEACCPVPDDDGMPEDDPEDPPEPEDEKRLWGVKTVATFDTFPVQQTQIVAAGEPNLYVPDLGSVRFAVEVAGRRAWTMDQKIRTLSQFTPVNAPATAYAFSVVPRPGVSIQTIPIVVAV